MKTVKFLFVFWCLLFWLEVAGYQLINLHNQDVTPKIHKTGINASSTINQSNKYANKYFEKIRTAVPGASILRKLILLDEETKQSFEQRMTMKREQLSERGLNKLRKKALSPNITQTSALSLQPRIVGGQSTHSGQFAYQMLILYTLPPYEYCGGALLSRRWILTAAHCLRSRSPKDFVITAGEYSLENDYTEQVSGLSSIFVHPKNEGGKKFDIALGKLDRKITYSPFVQAIRLATTEVKAHTPCFISGWGKTGKNSHEQDGKLRMAIVYIAPLQVCYSFWGKGRHKLCTYDPNKDAPYVGGCYGDSGGPLACFMDGTLVLAGVISFGPTECGEKMPFKPAGYANVAFLYTWIHDTIVGN